MVMDGWRWDPDDSRAYVKHLLPEEMPNRIATTFAGDPKTQRGFSWYQKTESDAPQVILSTDPSFPASTLVEVDAARSVIDPLVSFLRMRQRRARR